VSDQYLSKPRVTVACLAMTVYRALGIITVISAVIIFAAFVSDQGTWQPSIFLPVRLLGLALVLEWMHRVLSKLDAISPDALSSASTSPLAEEETASRPDTPQR